MVNDLNLPIPKIIHYCWFGRGDKPSDAVRYIAGWKKLLPEYRIIEWNEENFDIHVCPYVEQAYAARRFAFVSDYARGHALYEHGGVYLDTDVEVLKTFEDLLHHRSFWGFEAENFIATSTIGAVPKHEILKAYLEQYHTRQFLRPDGSHDTTPNVVFVTRLWEKHGLIRNNELQVVGNDNLFLPQSHLSPYEYTSGVMAPLNDAYAIHHYAKTWLSPWARVKGSIKKQLVQWFGPRIVIFLKMVVSGNNRSEQGKKGRNV